MPTSRDSPSSRARVSSLGYSRPPSAANRGARSMIGRAGDAARSTITSSSTNITDRRTAAVSFISRPSDRLPTMRIPFARGTDHPLKMENDSLLRFECAPHVERIGVNRHGSLNDIDFDRHGQEHALESTDPSLPSSPSAVVKTWSYGSTGRADWTERYADIFTSLPPSSRTHAA